MAPSVDPRATKTTASRLAGWRSPRLARRTRGLGLCLGVAAALLVPAVARAAVHRSGDEVIVAPHEVIEDDLIVFGDYVLMEGIVKGDLVVLGSEVVVEGVVEGDLIAAAKTLFSNGVVGDDARIAAFAIALGEGSVIGDDLFALAYSVEAQAGSRVGGSVHALGRQLIAAGQVAEDLLARLGALRIEGLVGGRVEAIVGGIQGVTQANLVVDPAIEVPDVEPGIAVWADARIGGELVYSAPEEAEIDAGARIGGGVRREEWPDAPGGPLVVTLADDFEEEEDAGALGLRRLAVLVAMGLLVVLAGPRWADARTDDLRYEPIRMLGWGISTLIAVWLASFVLAVVFATLFALALSLGSGALAWTTIAAGFLAQAIVGAPTILAIFFVAPALACLGLGRYALDRLRPERVQYAAITVVVGAVVYVLIRAVPGLGLGFGIVATLAGLGTIATWLRDLREA